MLFLDVFDPEVFLRPHVYNICLALAQTGYLRIHPRNQIVQTPNLGVTLACCFSAAVSMILFTSNSM